MRMKENKEFQASETDYLEAIDAAKNAIIVLGKHNPYLAQVRAAAHHLLDARVSQMVDSSRRQGSIWASGDEKVKVLSMEFSIVESLSGLQESIFSLFRSPHLNSGEK